MTFDREERIAAAVFLSPDVVLLANKLATDRVALTVAGVSLEVVEVRRSNSTAMVPAVLVSTELRKRASVSSNPTARAE
jgi:hypothetical protein